MPRVSAFYGVAIYMYWNERDHPVAHFVRPEVWPGLVLDVELRALRALLSRA